MRILVLEDDKTRQRAFRRKFIGHSVEIVETGAVAIQLLASRTWDAVFLDHDLGGETMQQSGPGTGYEVAEWLARNPDKVPKSVYIHSFNPAGAQRMKDIIPGSVLAPGCWISDDT